MSGRSGSTRGVAHVWSIDVENEAVQPALDVLNASEREQFERSLRPDRGLRFGVTRGALRIVLGGLLGLAPREIAFRRRSCHSCGEPHGKPELDGGSDLSFNVSHAGRHALVAVARNTPVGVDIEQIGRARNPLALAARWFSAGDSARLASLAEGELDEEFARMWARRESYLKATGRGIGGMSPALDVVPGRAPGRHVLDLAAPDGYAAALAVLTDADVSVCTHELLDLSGRGLSCPDVGRVCDHA